MHIKFSIIYNNIIYFVTQLAYQLSLLECCVNNLKVTGSVDISGSLFLNRREDEGLGGEDTRPSRATLVALFSCGGFKVQAIGCHRFIVGV